MQNHVSILGTASAAPLENANTFDEGRQAYTPAVMGK